MIIKNISKKYLEDKKDKLIPNTEYTIDYEMNNNQCKMIFESVNPALTRYIKLCKDEHDLIKLVQRENVGFQHIRGN